MKKLIVIICILLIIIIGVINIQSFAISPMAIEQNVKTRYFPSIATNLYRICDNEGNLIRFLELQDVSYSIADEGFYYKDAKYVMEITINTEFIENEYMELIIKDENEITVYLNDIKVPVDRFGNYNIVHIIESGVIRIE